MDTGLRKKNALVLSSSRGLGLGIAEALADEGANVLLTGRSEERLKGGGVSVVKELLENSVDCKAKTIKLDKPTPLVIYIHGGGFGSGDKSKHYNSKQLVSFLEKGMSCLPIKENDLAHNYLLLLICSSQNFFASSKSVILVSDNFWLAAKHASTALLVL